MPRRKIEKKTKLSSEFSKPIQVRPRPATPSGGARKMIVGAQERFENELIKWFKDLDAAHLARLEKFMRLPAEYGLDKNDPNCWFMVAWELANQHLTGLQIHVQNKPGAKTKWDATRLAVLFYEVQFRIDESKRKRTVSEICQELTKTLRWKGFSKKTLETMYGKAIESPLVQISQGIAKDHNARVTRAAIEPLYASLDGKHLNK